MKPTIPRWMDELGLTPIQFRVLANLWRRAQKPAEDWICWPSGESIRADCKIGDDALWAALNELERLGLVTRRKRFRNSNCYVLTVPVVTRFEGVTDAESPVRTGEQLPGFRGCQLPVKTGQQLPGFDGYKGGQRRETIEGGQGKGCAPAPETDDAWLTRLQAARPDVDIRAQVREAQARKAKKGEALERLWFEEHWLPKCSPIVTRHAIRASAPLPGGEDEPDGWRDALGDFPLGDTVREEGLAWKDLNADQQKLARDQVQMRKGAA